MLGPNYGAAQSHIEELMREREDFIQASKAQARRVAELEASLAAATELHEAAQEQLEVQSLIAEHRATRIHELEEETRAQANTMGKCVEPPHCATRPRSAASGTAPRSRWDPASRDACSVRGVQRVMPTHPSTSPSIQAARSRASLVGSPGEGEGWGLGLSLSLSLSLTPD